MRRTRTAHGGSLASDSVLNRINCQTFEDMNATNQYTGGSGVLGKFKVVNVVGGRSGTTKKKPTVRPQNWSLRGGQCSDSSTSLDLYGSPNPPSGMASAQPGSFDYSAVGHSVLNALQSEASSGAQMFNKVAFPAGMQHLKVYSM